MTTVSFIPRAGKLEVRLPPLPPLRSSQGLDLTVFKVLSRFPHRVVFNCAASDLQTCVEHITCSTALGTSQVLRQHRRAVDSARLRLQSTCSHYKYLPVNDAGAQSTLRALVDPASPWRP